MTRRELPSREPYPQFEPMAWSGEIDAEMPTSRIVIRGLIVLAFILLNLAYILA